MKILFVISSLATGGAEVSLVAICNEAVKRGHEVMVISLTSPSLNFLNRFSKLVNIRSIDMKSTSQFLASIFLFYKIINTFKPKIVHSHMIHANLFCAFCKFFRILTVPLIATAHSDNEGSLSFLYRLVKSNFNRSIHVSQSGLKIYLDSEFFLLDRSLYIANGIETPLNLSNNQNFSTGIRFVTVGRLVAVKNHELMISAVAMAFKFHSNIRLDIYGEGPLKNHLQSYIQSLGAERYIFLKGEITNVQHELAQSHFFLLSSNWEGMPLSLLESCAAGIPCVVTDVGSCANVVHDLPYCYLVPPKNLTLYVEKIMILLSYKYADIEPARHLIMNKVIENYSIDTSVNSLMDCYDSVVS
jgi:glycosyltransferase involved in cell wall biosynthesis